MNNKINKIINDWTSLRNELINDNELMNITKDKRNQDTAAIRFSPYPSPLEEDQPQKSESRPPTCLKHQNAKFG